MEKDESEGEKEEGQDTQMLHVFGPEAMMVLSRSFAGPEMLVFALDQTEIPSDDEKRTICGSPVEKKKTPASNKH